MEAKDKSKSEFIKKLFSHEDGGQSATQANKAGSSHVVEDFVPLMSGALVDDEAPITLKHAWSTVVNDPGVSLS